MTIYNGQLKLNEALNQESCTGKWSLRVDDPCTQAKLDDVITALGGSSTVVRTIYNVSATTAGTEYSQNLGANCLKYILRSRNKGKVQLSFASGGDYITIPKYANIEDSGLSVSALTLYFKSDVNNDIIEIISYNKA